MSSAQVELVKDEELRAPHQPLSEQHELLLAARERSDLTACERLEPELVKHLAGLFKLALSDAKAELFVASEQEGL